MPLRVPELAPSLGRVLVPRRLADPWVPLDDIREELATRVLELGGEARAAAVREERERVLEAVSRRAWLGAWERAVAATGLARECFLPESLTHFVEAYEARTGRRARLTVPA